MKFNSQICTTREQSERLIALGLKKETADMVHFFSQSLAQDWTIVPLAENETAMHIQDNEIPAWSLHRLLSLYNLHYIEFMNDEEIESVYDIVIDAITQAIEGSYFNEKYIWYDILGYFSIVCLRLLERL